MIVNRSPPRRNWADCWASKIRDRLERWSTGGALGMAGSCRGVRAMNQNSCPREVRRGKTPRKWPPGCCESSHSRGISLTVLFLGAVSCYPLMEPVRLSAEGPVHGDSAGCDPKMGLRCISLRLLTCGYVRHLLVVRIAQNAVDFSVFKGVGSQILGDRRLA